MHGVPASLDLSMFVGCTLDQLCIGMHQIQFHFSGPLGSTHPSLSVESRWECRAASGELVDRSVADDELPSDRDVYRVHVLLGHAVTSFAVDPPHSVTLTFESGATLTVWDDSLQYESFHVEPAGIHV